MMLREKIMCTAPLLFFNLTIKFFFKFPAEFLEKILCVDSKWHYQATHKIFSKNSAGNLKKNLIVRLKKSNGAVYMIFSGNFISRSSQLKSQCMLKQKSKKCNAFCRNMQLIGRQVLGTYIVATSCKRSEFLGKYFFSPFLGNGNQGVKLLLHKEFCDCNIISTRKSNGAVVKN